MSHTNIPVSDTAILDLIFASIEARGWIPDEAPSLPHFPPHFHRDNLHDLTIEMKGDLVIANIHFFNVPEGQPDTIGTPDAMPLPPQLALLKIAVLLTEIITGEQRVPFFFLGEEMICCAYESRNSSWAPPWRK